MTGLRKAGIRAPGPKKTKVTADTIAAACLELVIKVLEGDGSLLLSLTCLSISLTIEL